MPFYESNFTFRSNRFSFSGISENERIQIFLTRKTLYAIRVHAPFF